MRPRYFILILLLVFLIVQGFFVFLRAPHLDGLFSLSFWKNMGKVGHVMLLAEESYVAESQANFDALGDNALHGLIGGLDSYSSYLSVPEFEEYDIPTRQSYGGVGAEVREIEGRVVISGLNPDGGAREAGFLPGDWIVEVEGENVADDGIAGVVMLLRGKPETEVEMGVRRNGHEGVLRSLVERRNLSFSSIRSQELLNGNIGYVAVSIFGQNTATELSEGIADLRSKGAEGFIIDVRNNPGGLLMAAQQVVDLFIPAQMEFLTIEGRDDSVIESFRTSEEPIIGEALPLVILQNRMSASASEIFAGALQAFGRALVVGEVSHGKGSVQSVYKFTGGDGVSMTTARYILPNGREIEGVGLEPNVQVDVTSEELFRVSVQESHDIDLTDTEFEQRFGFPRTEDKILKQAIEVIETQLSTEESESR